MSQKKSIEIEMLALEQVPISKRQHWSSVTLIQAGYMVTITSLWTGSIMVAGMSLMESVIAGTVGYVIVVALCIIQGMQGSDLGVPSIVASTSSFGDKGSRVLISAVFIITSIGWFAINANLCGAAFSGVMSESFGINIPIKLSIMIFGLLMVSTAVVGFNGLKYLNMISVPVMSAVCIYGIYLALSKNGLQELSTYVPTSKMTMIDGISLVIGGYAIGCVCAADCTRYQRSRRDVVISQTIGTLPAGVALLWGGAVLAIVAGTEDLTKIFVSLGIPFLGLIALILSTWPANSGNAYSAGLDVVKMFNLKDSKRAIATVLCGIAGTVVGCFQIILYFQEILMYFGIATAPIAGVMIADYWILGKGNPKNWKPTPGVNTAGVIAWIIGTLVSLLIKTGIPSINGVAISMIVYVIIKKTQQMNLIKGRLPRCLCKAK